MKIFNRTYLPEFILYNKKRYVKDVSVSTYHMLGNKPDLKGCIMVKVLSLNLRGKLDLHQQPYKPTEHIYKPEN